MIPVSLLDIYNKKDQFRCSLLTWDSGNKLLTAFLKMCISKHATNDPAKFSLPWTLVDAIYDTVKRMVDNGSLPSPAISGSICHSMSYISVNTKASIRMVKAFAKHAYLDTDPKSKEYDSMMHQLWQTGKWLKKKTGESFSRSMVWAELEAARERSLAGTKKKGGSGTQRIVRDELEEIRKVDRRIEYVSPSASIAPSVPCPSVWTLVRTKHHVIVEFDGCGHFVGPFGWLNGSTLWRNYLLSKYAKLGYKLVTVSEADWNAEKDKKALLLKKLKDYL